MRNPAWAGGTYERNIVLRPLKSQSRSMLGLCGVVVGDPADPAERRAGQGGDDVYPAGGSTFSGGPQGWQVTDATCNLPLLCTASGGYDGDNGNPSGSIAAKPTIGLNLLSLFKSTVTLQSPDFTVTEGPATSTLHLDRQFDPGSLVDLSPQATYTVTLIDRTSGHGIEALRPRRSALPPGSSARTRRSSVVAGHTYAISITPLKPALPWPAPACSAAPPAPASTTSRSRGQRAMAAVGQRRQRRHGAGGKGGLTDEQPAVANVRAAWSARRR